MRNFLVILLLLLASACGTTRTRSAVALHDLGPIDFAHDRSGEKAVFIDISAPDWLTGTQLYYRQLFLAPTILKTYTRDRWIASPVELLERRFGLIKNKHELVLRIQLVEFEQQFYTPEQARTVLSFNVRAYHRHKRKMLGQRFFTYQQINKTANALGGINSFVELSNLAADDLAGWLDTLIQSNLSPRLKNY